ncbi:MAG: polymerase, sigma-24 subunit, RpoE [Verrucomicrobiales bacterium]|nr:polymerase, sigma-24 subunit, RpoE [Verrucomicrobiales bacterium]
MSAIYAFSSAARLAWLTESPPRTMSAVSADLALTTAAKAGDSTAFGSLIAAHKSRVFGLAAKYARNHHELEDLAQDVFIKAWKGLGGYRGDAPFEHWLMRVAVRACFDFLRRNRSRREHEVSRDALLEAGYLPAEGAQETVETGENQALLEVRRAMAMLSPKEQHVLTLLELEDRTVREVAVLTGWSEANVKVRGFRARQALRKCIERLRQSNPPVWP